MNKVIITFALLILAFGSVQAQDVVKMHGTLVADPANGEMIFLSAIDGQYYYLEYYDAFELNDEILIEGFMYEDCPLIGTGGSGVACVSINSIAALCWATVDITERFGEIEDISDLTVIVDWFYNMQRSPDSSYLTDINGDCLINHLDFELFQTCMYENPVSGCSWSTPTCCENNGWSCCVGMTGNTNCDPDEIVDIGDLTAMIDYLFICYGTGCGGCCPDEANTDGSGSVDIGDLTKLIDYLFISFTLLAQCQ